MDTRPIGVLDSGVGGLTVWKEIVSFLPNESTVYIGDSRHAPYGDRPYEEIHQLSRSLIQFLKKNNVKLIVIACNTITTSCLDVLRNEFTDIPLIGTVPVVKKAAELTKKKKIAILSTNRTAKSLYQKHLIEQFAKDLEVMNLGTNMLVPLIEKGEIDSEKVEKVLQNVLKPFQETIDVLALGCTHFPFLKTHMQKILGKKIQILDSGGAIARQVQRVLEKNNGLTNKKKAVHKLFTTGDKRIFTKIINQLVIPARAGIQILDKPE